MNDFSVGSINLPNKSELYVFLGLRVRLLSAEQNANKKLNKMQTRRKTKSVSKQFTEESRERTKNVMLKKPAV